MLISFPFPSTQASHPPATLAQAEKFYSSPANRPDIVVIYTDPYFEPANPFGSGFDGWYREFTTLKTPDGLMVVYTKR
jgi:hypothetical protein